MTDLIKLLGDLYARWHKRRRQRAGARFRRRTILLGLRWMLLTSVITAYPEPTALSPAQRPTYRSDRILVRVRPTADSQVVDRFHERQGVQKEGRIRGADRELILRLPRGGEVLDYLARYRASGLVEAAEPDYWIQLGQTPNDPLFTSGSQWAWHSLDDAGADADINALEAWATRVAAPEVVVAVIDSGIRLTHEDLRDNLWTNPDEIPGNGVDDDHNGVVDDVHGLDAVTNRGVTDDVDGHGTHVAGIIGARGNNEVGMAGVAWQVQLMACRFIDETGEGSVSDAIQCIDYARSMGAKVINASWGAPYASSFLERAVRRACDDGILVVAAAGNHGTDTDVTPFYPASFPFDNVVAVTATTADNDLAHFSNYGAENVDLAAPGSLIRSTSATSDSAYATMSGTSMAAPFVAGAIALLRAQYPAESADAIRARLLAGVDPLGSLDGLCATGGRLNLAAALGAPEGGDAPSLTLTAAPASSILTLRIQAAPGQACLIESSGDFREWVAWETVTVAADGVVSVEAAVDPASERRFFRARLAEGL